MESLKISSSHLPSPSNYAIFKRLANLAIGIIAAVICVNLWLINTQQAAIWHDHQAQQLGRSMAEYAAKVVAQDMKESDPDAIASHLSIIAKDKHVLGVSLFKRDGTVVDSNEANPSVLASFTLDDNPPLVFVEEIVFGEEILGYLRLLVSEQHIMVFHDEYQQQMYQQLLVLMMLAGLAGLLVSRAYYKIRFRHYVKANN